MNNPCQHTHLNFTDGGMFLICEECSQKWMAVDQYNIPKFGLTPQQQLNVFSQRIDPFCDPDN